MEGNGSHTLLHVLEQKHIKNYSDEQIQTLKIPSLFAWQIKEIDDYFRERNDQGISKNKSVNEMLSVLAIYDHRKDFRIVNKHFIFNALLKLNNKEDRLIVSVIDFSNARDLSDKQKKLHTYCLVTMIKCRQKKENVRMFFKWLKKMESEFNDAAAFDYYYIWKIICSFGIEDKFEIWLDYLTVCFPKLTTEFQLTRKIEECIEMDIPVESAKETFLSSLSKSYTETADELIIEYKYKKMHKSPLLSYLKKYYDIPSDPKERYYKDTVDEKLIEHLKGQPYDLMVMNPNFCIMIRLYHDSLIVDLNKYNKILVYGQQNRPNHEKDYYLMERQLCQRIIIYDEKSIYSEFNKYGVKKMLPLTVKKLFWIANINPLARKFFLVLLEFLSEQNTFFKDILKKYKNDETCLLPVSLNECAEYHNAAEMFHKKWKTSQRLKVNFNRTDLNLGYVIMKAYPYVDKDSREVLIQIKDKNYLKRISTDRTNIKDQVKELLINYYCKKLKIDVNHEDDMESVTYVYDYIRLCMKTKTKIRLTYNSIRRIIEEHDLLAQNDMRNNTGKVIIPENSCFVPLRKILPDNFSWIKSRKRLISEAVVQHSCVWSYADDINRDKCAIYSLVYNEVRYTIEFRYQENNYEAVQIQRAFNQGCSEEVRNYITSFLI